MPRISTKENKNINNRSTQNERSVIRAFSVAANARVCYNNCIGGEICVQYRFQRKPCK